MPLRARRFVGVRLERKKEASLLNWNLKRPYPPEKIRVALPPDSWPCVHSGNKVELGQKIAEARSPESVSVHAGMAGVVQLVSVFPDAFGRESLMVEIRRQGEPKVLPMTETRKGWQETTAKELLWIFQHSGLVVTDRSMEPVHGKLQRHPQARTILINVCEPEPYITCEQVLTQSHPVEILRGAELLRNACGAEKILFAVEETNLEMIELLKSKIYFLKWEHVEVRSVPALYPQGLESTLLQAWFFGGEGAVVFPASTAFAAYEAVALQKPFYERVVTVAGECVVEPRSLWLPLGISFQDAIRACKGMMREPRKVLAGGPMAGFAQTTLEVAVLSGTQAILALPPEATEDASVGPCIRCNRCVDHCPVFLLPALITLAVEQQEWALARDWNVSACIECGNCSYVCPSKRPMLELLRVARGCHAKEVALV